MNMFHST